MPVNHTDKTKQDLLDYIDEHYTQQKGWSRNGCFFWRMESNAIKALRETIDTLPNGSLTGDGIHEIRLTYACASGRDHKQSHLTGRFFTDLLAWLPERPRETVRDYVPWVPKPGLFQRAKQAVGSICSGGVEEAVQGRNDVYVLMP